MKHIITTLSIFLGCFCLRSSAFARMPKPYLYMRTTIKAAGDDSLFEAEEAAAIDAHDVNDSGLEAAAMERAVMLAEEYKEQQMKKNDKKKVDRIKAIEEHYKQVKKDIEAIERLIKEADDADHASVRRNMLVPLCFLVVSIHSKHNFFGM